MNTIFVFVFLLIISPNAFAKAGGVGSGGGKGVLCTLSGIQTVESLDLWEARNLWGYSIPSSQSLEAEITRVFPIWYSSLHESPLEPRITYRPGDFLMYKSWYNHFISMHREIPAGSHLSPTNDATFILQPPPNCQIVQILVYLDEGTNSAGILVDPIYWNLLDDQNKLALYFHEMIYKTWRDADGNYSNTDNVRKYVGALFASNPFPAKTSQVRLSEKALSCKTVGDNKNENTAHFYITPVAGHHEGLDARSTIYFEWLGNFGKFEAPVEYSGTTFIDYKYFENHIQQNLIGGPIQINSIFNGFKLYLGTKGNCGLGYSDSSCKFHLVQTNTDGTELSRPFVCEKVIPIQ